MPGKPEYQQLISRAPKGHTRRLPSSKPHLENTPDTTPGRTQRQPRITQELPRSTRRSPGSTQESPGESDGLMAHSVNSLGVSFQSLFQRTGDNDDLAKAISHFKSSANLHLWPSTYQIEWGKMLGTLAKDLLSLLQSTSGLPLQAAATAFAFDRIDKALEWLEQGRGLVWGQLTNLRTPLDDLREHDSQLASSITKVGKQLEGAGSSRASSRADITQQWDNLIARARTIPGFEAFLKPAPWSTLLQNLPGSGPIVLINLDHRRCDAIALLAGYDRPLHIPLPNFTLELCQKYREDLGGHYDHISYAIEEGRNFRRLGWREGDPARPLSFLPIHAAGIYGNAESESVLDYAVSSYTPTVAAITARVRDGRSIETNASGLLMTSQPNAPGVSSIPGTTTEVQAIYNLTEKPIARVKKLEGGDVSVAKCLELMGTYSSVHFACHATQDAADPLKSRFLFHDGSLELATILKRDLKNADLAFLSAVKRARARRSYPTKPFISLPGCLLQDIAEW
ncbi:hypothetical protein DFP72DRAFT_1131766 [Ephemerocybe angulata]|uniref:CHAT domain-containing protein n=1 Tax=Ephemerocybe angulata TaxID=980116 RepID=A0A8H6HWJ3_9AGAR|nr:hypothetical protein DFP72DRAFT_1131766 [Tulosesus angulatus]